MHVGIDGHLLSRGLTYRAAGISRHLSNLVARLPDSAPSDRFTVFVGPDGAPRGGGDPRILYRVAPLPTHRPGARIIWEQAIAPLESAVRGLDVFHGPAYALPLVATCPTVVTFHDLSFMRMPWLFNRANRAYLTTSARLAVRGAARIIAVSDFTRRELVELLGVPEGRIEVIPNGVEASFRPLDADQVARFRAERGLPEQFILYLGTLEPRKNVQLLVRAFNRLRRERDVPHALVLAGGKGWLYDEIFAEVRALGLEGSVYFPGFVPFDEQPLWYNSAAAFAYPSLYEGFGMPALEALACGTPVVCANSSSLPEVVGDAGLMVPPEDEQALADALWRVIDDGALRDRLEREGVARARRFDWADVAHRTLGVYRVAAAA